MRRHENMHFRNGQKIVVFLLTVSVLVSSLFILVLSPITLASADPNGGYTYYGIVPAKIYQYNLTDPNDPTSDWQLDTASDATAAMLTIVAAKNNTQVSVYIQDNGTLVSEAILNSMQKHYVVLPNGTMFKVVTSELACVLLLNYGSGGPPVGNETEGPIPTAYYPSTGGAYVGKEFVFMASERSAEDYIVLSLENAEITITRDDGNQRTYTLDANSYVELMLIPFRTYRFESTGNIMIKSGRPTNGWDDARIFYVPAAEGGFVGKTFYTWSHTSWDQRESYGFRVSATQNARITVWDLQTKEVIITADVTGGSGFGFKPQAPAIVVQSNQPVTLQYIHNGTIEHALYDGFKRGTYDAYGSGVAYIGVRPDEDTPIYFPSNCYIEAYFFANEETQITIDGSPYTLSPDSCYRYTQPGTHIIRSDKNIIVQVLNWPSTPEIQGLQYDGFQIPCIQTVHVVPNVILTPLGEAFPITYIAIGAATATIAVVAVFLLRKRHS
jgi:hypothetical protein